MFDPESITKALSEGGVEFVVIGGIAAVMQGATYVTQDFDICYARDKQNCDRLARALQPYQPHLRGIPRGVPFVLDGATLRNGQNFTLETTIGDVDLLGEVAGVGTYQDVVAHSEYLDVYGCQARVLTVVGLIKAKEAAGRLKDRLLLPELEALLGLRRKGEQ